MATRGFISLILALAIAVGIVALSGAGWWVSKQKPPTLSSTIGRSATTTLVEALATTTDSTTAKTEPVAAQVIATRYGENTDSPVSGSAPPEKSFLAFSSPRAGDVLTTDSPIFVQYSLTDSELQVEFPDFKVLLGFVPVGSGNMKFDEGSLYDSPLPLTGSYTWDIAASIKNGLYPGLESGTYRMEAMLTYAGGAKFSCDPSVRKECSPVYPEPIQSEINAARQYKSYGDSFTLTISPETLLLSCRIWSTPSTTKVGEPVTLSWNTDNAWYIHMNGYGIDSAHTQATNGNALVTFVEPGTYNYDVTAAAYKVQPGVHPDTASCNTSVVVQ